MLDMNSHIEPDDVVIHTETCHIFVLDGDPYVLIDDMLVPIKF